MKRGRKAIDIPCPQGYPVRLYDVDGKMVPALSKDYARKHGKKIKLVKFTDLVSANGHVKTNQILKQFGPRWVCKEGHIFYTV